MADGGGRPGIWLLAILTVGFGLRLWGISFGLPNVNCRPDESVLVHKALAIASGDLNPHFFNYPSFQFYLLALLYGLYFAAGWALGAFAGVEQFEIGFFTDPSAFYLLGRASSALIGGCSVAIVYLLGRGMGGTRAGLLSAAFLATAFLHVRDSHFLTADVPATFHLLVAYAFTWRYIDRARPTSMLLAAVFFGFAVSTKYNVALIIPSGLLAVWLVARSPGVASSGRPPFRPWRHAVCAVAVMVVSFAATSPYVLLDFPTFLRDFQYEQAHFSRGHGLDLGAGWVYHLRVTLLYGLGWPLAAVSAAAEAGSGSPDGHSPLLSGSGRWQERLPPIYDPRDTSAVSGRRRMGVAPDRCSQREMGRPGSTGTNSPWDSGFTAPQSDPLHR